MDLFSIFKGGKYFDKNIQPKCDYCHFGRRAKDGNKVICEKYAFVERDHSCGKFIYSPLKRIPVKQLNFVGSLADEDIYTESAGDRAEKENVEKKADESKANKPAETKKEEVKPDKNESNESKAEEIKTEEAEKTESAKEEKTETAEENDSESSENKDETAEKTE